MNTDPLFSTPSMAALFSPHMRIQNLLAVEVALARACATVGLVTTADAEALRDECEAMRLDPHAIFASARTSGTPIIPLLAALEQRLSPKASRALHVGATSQDILDTAFALHMRAGLRELRRDLKRAALRCATLADRHRSTLMLGRTLLQPALPITFGLKTAQWLASLTRTIRRLDAATDEISVLQLGGAVGTLAAFGDHGLAVVDQLAIELDLAVPDLPSHASRDRITHLLGLLDGACGIAAKIARDVASLSQAEIGEVRIAGGGSSAMPHKHNPVDAMIAIASARIVHGHASTVVGSTEHEHERALGAWQIEWVAIPAVFEHAAATFEALARLLTGLEPNPERMLANLRTQPDALMAEALATALLPSHGRTEAYRLVTELVDVASSRGTSLHATAAADPRIALTKDGIDDVFDHSRYLGATSTFIERALQHCGTLP